MSEVKKIIVGVDKIPTWFNEECSKGRAKIVTENGKLLNIIVHNVSRTVTANIGDVIILYNSGLSVIPADKAVKYYVKKDVVKNPINREEK